MARAVYTYTVHVAVEAVSGGDFVDQLRPPFRADHVGSLLRPPELRDVRERAALGTVSREDLIQAEDQAILDAIDLQVSAGLKGITDGEFRRNAWHTDFLTALDGVDPTHSSYAVSFKGEHGKTEAIGTMLAVTGKIRRSRPIMVNHFKFLQGAVGPGVTAKFCIPSPTYLHMRGGRRTVPANIYPDIEEFWADVVEAYRLEIADLAAAGCRYLQLDDVSVSMLCDETIRAQARADGEDPDVLPRIYANVINAIIRDRPAGMAVTVHTCRGNHRSMWMAEGGYEAVADSVFNTLEVDGLFLEFDTDRAGGFEPLRYAPADKRIVLGLVSSKTPELESKDDLKRRIDAAAKFAPLENLCISPQCGFASTAVGNQITVDIERRKLALVTEVADEVWGNA